MWGYLFVLGIFAESELFQNWKIIFGAPSRQMPIDLEGAEFPFQERDGCHGRQVSHFTELCSLSCTMPNITPADVPLPEIIDPVLSFLSSKLPPPLYSFLLSFLSHSLALFASLLSLVLTLASTKPWEWDAKTLLPPIISIFAAYIALLSLYRTTSWMIRVSVWFVKWGVILAAAIAAAGWYATNINGVAIPGASGVASGLGGLLVDMLNVNGQGERAVGSRPKPTSRSRTKSSYERMEGKPKPWHSFEQHRGWQEQDRDVQQIIGNIDRIAVGCFHDGARPININDFALFSLKRNPFPQPYDMPEADTCDKRF